MADLNKIIDELSKLTVVEAAELSKQLEEKWGVTAAAAVAAPAVGAAAGGGAPAEEKSEFTVVLASAGDKKINVIKEVRAVTACETPWRLSFLFSAVTITSSKKPSLWEKENGVKVVQIANSNKLFFKFFILMLVNFKKFPFLNYAMFFSPKFI